MTAKCGFCQSTRFKAETKQVDGTKFPYMFIYCANCGAVISVKEDFNISSLLFQLAEKLRVNIR